MKTQNDKIDGLCLTLNSEDDQTELMERLAQMDHKILDMDGIRCKDYIFKLSIIGASAVGKSCLLNRITRNEFLDDHDITIGVEFGSLLISIE